MAYRFQSQETIPSAVRRIAAEEIDAARADLSGVTQNHTEGIHEARKRLKKLRGLLRLVRSNLGSTFAAENQAFRDAARALSDLRESDALLEALDKLESPVPAEILERVEDQLARQRARVVGSASQLSSAVDGVLPVLDRARVASWPLEREDFGALEPGLRGAYRAARRQLEVALEDPSPGRLHEWRKRVKDHWYHVRLLAGCGPEALEERQVALHRLSELLGDHHDFSMLRATLEAAPSAYGGARDVTILVDAIETHRQGLVQEARVLGQELFALKPRRFVRRVGEAWDRWRANEPTVSSGGPGHPA